MKPKPNRKGDTMKSIYRILCQLAVVLTILIFQYLSNNCITIFDWIVTSAVFLLMWVLSWVGYDYSNKEE